MRRRASRNRSLKSKSKVRKNKSRIIRKTRVNKTIRNKTQKRNTRRTRKTRRTGRTRTRTRTRTRNRTRSRNKRRMRGGSPEGAGLIEMNITELEGYTPELIKKLEVRELRLACIDICKKLGRSEDLSINFVNDKFMKYQEEAGNELPEEEQSYRQNFSYFRILVELKREIERRDSEPVIEIDDVSIGL